MSQHGAAAAGPPADGTDVVEPARASDLYLDEALRAAQRGDSTAFRVLYRDLQPRLLRYLRALVADDAEDVASETWLQVARDMPGFSGNYDGFRGWATTIARHRAMDHLRRTSRRPPSAPVPTEALTWLAGGDDTAELAMEAISTDAAIRIIASLPSDQAEAVLLRAVVGLDADTAGKILGKRAGAVRTAAYRGLRSLAKRLPGLRLDGASELSRASGLGLSRASRLKCAIDTR